MSNETSPGSANRGRTDELIEWISAGLLALVTLATAWCGYQASQWNGEQSISFGKANAARVESTRQENAGNMRRSIHVGLFVEYASAVSSGNEKLATFLFERFPAELKTATTAWLALDPLHNPAAPASPFEMSEYQLPEYAQSEQLSATASGLFAEGLVDDNRGDRYTLMTVLFATVLFFVGISGRFAGRGPRIALIVLGAVLFLIGLSVIATFPVIPL
jgi:hypothetical protein